MAHAPNRLKARKDDFYVRVGLPDSTSQWFPATDFLYSDKPMPFSKPLATCAVRVYDDVVTFSHLLVRKKAASQIAERGISMPSSALTRLAKRAAELDLSRTDIVLVERAVEDEDGNLTNILYPFRLTRDEHNIVELELLDVTETQAAEHAADIAALQATAAAAGTDSVVADQRDPIVLSRRAEKMSVFLRSPKIDRVLAISWIGHFNRPPGDPETMTRAVGKILNALRDLPTFSALADLEQARVPALAGATAAPAASAVSNAEFTLPISIYTADEQPLGAGDTIVKFDLTALVATELRLAYTVEIPDELAATFTDEHQTQLDWAVRTELLRHARSDLESIAFDVTLGEVDDSTVERLAAVVAGALPGVHLAPDKYANYQQTPVA